MPPAWPFGSQLSSLRSCPSLGLFRKALPSRGPATVSCGGDVRRKAPRPELLPERVGFSKFGLTGSWQAAMTTFTRLRPVVFIAQILFISFDVQSSRFHSKDISSQKSHRTTCYKPCVYVSSAFAEAGFSPPPHSLSRRGISGLPLPRVHLRGTPCDPRRLTHAV